MVIPLPTEFSEVPERPHAVIKRVFGAGRVLVTTVQRVSVKMMVTAFAFNLYQLCTLKNARII
jgi:IS5 family transposase